MVDMVLSVSGDLLVDVLVEHGDGDESVSSTTVVLVGVNAS
jgi:hypothetical protein